MIRFLRVFFGVLLVSASVQSVAADVVAQVIKVQGDVEIRDKDGKPEQKAVVGSNLSAGQSLHTSADGMAAIRTSTGDTFVINSLAAARARNEQNTFEHLFGKVLYMFTPNKKIERNVRVRTATMGIRGTVFLVDASDDSAAVGLKEGRLEITSLNDGFKVYKQKELDDFQAFKRQSEEGVAQQQADFEKYKVQVQEEFVAYKKSLQLESQQSLTLQGDKAVVGGISDEMEKTLAALRAFVSK